MSWFVDNAITLYILLALIAAALLMIWRSNRQNKYLGYAAGAVVLILLIFLLSFFYVSDAKQLRINVDAMAKGVVDGKVDDLFKHISDDFVYDPKNQKLTRDQLYELARGVINK